MEIDIRFSMTPVTPNYGTYRGRPQARAYVAGYSPASVMLPGWGTFLNWWHLVGKCVEFTVTGKVPL